MLKRFVYIIIFIGFHLITSSQYKHSADSTSNTQIENLKKQLLIVKNDSLRIRIIQGIGFNYEVLNLDSSIKYTEQGLLLASKLRYFWGEVALMIDLATIFREQGKLSESLEMLLKSLEIAKANNIRFEIARAYRRLSDIYMDLENFPKAIGYLLQADKIDREEHRKKSVQIDEMTLAFAFEKINKLDSASLLINSVFQQPDVFSRQYAYQVLGNIQSKKGNYPQAIHFFREGLLLSQKEDDFLTASGICGDVATLFIKLNRRDSAIMYALMGFNYGAQVSFRKGSMLNGNILAKLYDSTRPSLALKYYKMAAAAKDSLFGINNIQAIQDLLANEQVKQKELEDTRLAYQNRLRIYGLLVGLALVLIFAFILFRNNLQRRKANIVLQEQKIKVETTLVELKSTQAKLIQSEKMATLGEFTAGIAHEIQNPLNFVNNFAEVNIELMAELKDGIVKGNTVDVQSIADSVIENGEKILAHGKRADGIVKSMLQHSRKSSGQNELTDLNALADEYLRLTYHGLRSKDNSWSATTKTDFDLTIGNINIVPQDIGRVLLNLYNNAFYAVSEKRKQIGKNFEPTVLVSTKKLGNKVEIRVKDNGNGIPQKIIDKIFQPFFTTKPTGQGTGLGLSLSYDIVKAQGGEIRVETKDGDGAEFIIQIPVV